MAEGMELKPTLCKKTFPLLYYFFLWVFFSGGRGHIYWNIENYISGLGQYQMHYTECFIKKES